jgi:hypothetical protein
MFGCEYPLMRDRAFACGFAVLLAVAISACGDDSQSEAGPAPGSAEAKRIETATEAVERTGKSTRGEEVKCTAMTADAFECVASVETADDTGNVTLETYLIVLFEKRTLRVAFTGGRVLGSQPSEGAYDCEGSDRDKCIELARKSGGFRLIGPNGPLGARIPGDAGTYSSRQGAR